MYSKAFPVVLLALLSTSSVFGQTDKGGVTLSDFEKRAAKFNAVITVPHFETSTNELQSTLKQTIENGNGALDKIGKLQREKVTFENTVRALDDLGYEIG